MTQKTFFNFSAYSDEEIEIITEQLRKYKDEQNATKKFSRIKKIEEAIMSSDYLILSNETENTFIWRKEYNHNDPNNTNRYISLRSNITLNVYMDTINVFTNSVEDIDIIKTKIMPITKEEFIDALDKHLNYENLCKYVNENKSDDDKVNG